MSTTDPHKFQQYMKAPVLRVLIFLTGLIAIVFLDIRLGGLMFDPNCIYPFLILLSAPCSLYLKIGWDTITVIRRSSLSVGVAVCCLNLIALISNADDIQSLGYRFQLLYHPAILGILVFFLMSPLEPERIKEYSLTKHETTGFAFTSAISWVVAVFFMASRNDTALQSFFDLKVLFFSLFLILFVLANPRLEAESFIDKFKKAPLLIFIISAAIGVYAYTIAIMQQVDQLVPLMSIGFPTRGILSGSFFAIIAVGLEYKRPDESQNSMSFDWHMIEIYVFYALIIFPPLSIIEYYF